MKRLFANFKAGAAIMEEAFLHFIWKFQHFRTPALTTDDGQELIIFHPGLRNTDAGPDFLNARIKIGEITWNGHVEIHVTASDWSRHSHQFDKAYNNVILHVVWENNVTASRADGNIIPTLVLKDLLLPHLYLNYKKLLEPGDEILCRNFIRNVKPITIINMADRAVAGRLQERAESMLRELFLAQNDWEEVAWRFLCRSFGFRTNADAFFDLGKSLPFKIIKKECQNPSTIEALLYGQAGFLDDAPVDEYQALLKKEYDFKYRKYGLEKRLHRHRWKFLRLRPANFPTIRISQLSAVIGAQPTLFSFFTEYENSGDLKKAFYVQPSQYWTEHYQFGEKTSHRLGGLGKSSIDNILINTCGPIALCLGNTQG
ncbi:MAG: DUF2851 family protein [Cyclobacteriaceae bacterium]|nr:DUF2851 family protein [Cyclobacteriaceae bacterium]